MRPDSHARSTMIRYLDCGADGLMVAMVETVAQPRAIVETVRYACPADHKMRLVICMIETLEAIAERPRPVHDAVAGALAKIRAAGKIGERWPSSTRWSAGKAGVQFFYIHSDPFLRTGLARMRKLSAS